MKCFFFSISSGWQIIIHYSRFDPDSLDIRMHSEQKKIYQSMTPAQKLDVSMKLYLSAKALKTATIKEQHPDWNKEKIKKRVNDIFLYAGT
jgi:hypothetical protein